MTVRPAVSDASQQRVAARLMADPRIHPVGPGRIVIVGLDAVVFQTRRPLGLPKGRAEIHVDARRLGVSRLDEPGRAARGCCACDGADSYETAPCEKSDEHQPGRQQPNVPPLRLQGHATSRSDQRSHRTNGARTASVERSAQDPPSGLPDQQQGPKAQELTHPIR